MTALLDHWPVAFALTQAIEIPIFLAFFRRAGWRPPPPIAPITVAFLASALTHPIVWYAFPDVANRIGFCPALGLAGPACIPSVVVLAEIFAMVAEYAWLRHLGLRDALPAACAANVASLSVGLLLSSLLPAWLA